MALNPYTGLPAERFWRKVVTNVPPFAVNPHPKDTFVIGPTDKVATGGSCFAQRVAEAVRGADLVVAVIENPVINRVIFEGMRTLDEEDLEEELGFISPLDSVDLYVTFKNALGGKLRRQRMN